MQIILLFRMSSWPMILSGMATFIHWLDKEAIITLETFTNIQFLCNFHKINLSSTGMILISIISHIRVTNKDVNSNLWELLQYLKVKLLIFPNWGVVVMGNQW